MKQHYVPQFYYKNFGDMDIKIKINSRAYHGLSPIPSREQYGVRGYN